MDIQVQGAAVAGGLAKRDYPKMPKILDKWKMYYDVPKTQKAQSFD